MRDRGRVACDGGRRVGRGEDRGLVSGADGIWAAGVGASEYPGRPAECGDAAAVESVDQIQGGFPSFCADLPGGEALVKAFHFVYDNNGQNGFTFLKQLLVTGYTKHDDGHYTEKSLPPVEFSYEQHAWNKEIKNIYSLNEQVNNQNLNLTDRTWKFKRILYKK